MKKFRFIYKCRKCGNVFSQVTESTGLLITELTSSMYQREGHSFPLLIIHLCKANTHVAGVADLIGGEVITE